MPKPAVVRRTKGPVQDLEEHLPAEWWRGLFNANYLKTDGDVVEDPRNTRQDIDLVLDAVPLHPVDAVLDLCCGQGRHCLELARRGFRNLTGIDQSGYLIALARKRARVQGADIAFRRADIRSCSLARGAYRCILMLGNSFGYFEREQDDVAVLGSVRDALAPGGSLILDLTDGDWVRGAYQPRTWEWIGPKEFVCRERCLSADRSRLVAREVITHAERGVIADQFYAERLYSRAGITALLERAGFAGICDRGNVQSDSARNQDLGMMAQRMFLVAQTAKALVRAAVR